MEIRRSVSPSRVLFLTLTLSVLVSCGGRVAREVKASNEHDGLLTCIHLVSQSEVNFGRISDLKTERKNEHAQNVGRILFTGPFALNLNDSEKKEILALIERNKELARLKKAKNC